MKLTISETIGNLLNIDSQLAKQSFHFELLDSLIIVGLSFGIYWLIKKLILNNLRSSRINKKINQKGRTYLNVVTGIIKTLFILVTALILLQANGINVASLLAGIGIVSIIVGLALQDVLKDIIRGFNLLSDEYFNVGDVIEFNGKTGVVQEFGLRSTKIKELLTGDIITIANRNMEIISVDAGNIYLNIPFSYETSLSSAEHIIDLAIEKILLLDHVMSARYLGLNHLNDSNMQYLIEVKCPPAERLRVRRSALGVIIRTFEENGEKIPYPQLDVHTKDAF